MSTPTVPALSRRVTNGSTPLQRGGESNVAPRVRLGFVGRSVGRSVGESCLVGLLPTQTQQPCPNAGGGRTAEAWLEAAVCLISQYQVYDKFVFSMLLQHANVFHVYLAIVCCCSYGEVGSYLQRYA